jgi:hypothetical protein
VRYGVWAPIPQYTNGVRKWTAGRAGRRITAVVIHKMDGNLDGSDSWLRSYKSGSASTHFGVGCWGWANRAIQRYQIRQWVDTTNSAYGWSARPTDSPTALARSVLAPDLWNGSADLNWQVIHIETEGWSTQRWPAGLTAKVRELLAAIGRSHGPLVIMAHTDISSKPCPGMSTVPWTALGGYGGRIGVPVSIPDTSTTIHRADYGAAAMRFRSRDDDRILRAGKPIRSGASVKAPVLARSTVDTKVRIVGEMKPTGSYDPWYVYRWYLGNGHAFVYSPRIDFK